MEPAELAGPVKPADQRSQWSQEMESAEIAEPLVVAEPLGAGGVGGAGGASGATRANTRSPPDQVIPQERRNEQGGSLSTEEATARAARELQRLVLGADP